MSRELHEKVHHSIREIGLDKFLKRSPECSCGLRFKRAEYLAEHQIEALRTALREVETPSPEPLADVILRGVNRPSNPPAPARAVDVPPRPPASSAAAPLRPVPEETQ